MSNNFNITHFLVSYLITISKAIPLTIPIRIVLI